MGGTFGQVWALLSWGSPLGLAFSFILGACLGSFANVVIWRLPRGQSIVRPGSRCPQCGTPIPLRNNIPILSYFLLHRRAPCCGNSISLRYPIIELICALILGLLYLLEGWTSTFLFAGTWMILLVILAAVDLEHYRLPNVLVGLGAVWSLLWMIFAREQSWTQAGLGLLAALLLSGVMLLMGRKAAGQWSGFGDVKLMAVLGFAFGLGRFAILILSANLAALIYGLFLRKRLTDKRIPLGPFLALGTWVTLWCGEYVVRWYMGMFHFGF